jgi:hypothetical protein
MLRAEATQQTTDELPTILDRAAQYVAQYEEKELGNLLVNEVYNQKATFFADGVVVQDRKQRRIESDFLIFQAGTRRIGVRRVNRVDGKEVKSKEAPFEDMKVDSLEAFARIVEALREESTRYDIGEVLRRNNVPTFALKVVRKEEASRFAFTRNGTEKISGVQTWKVKFREERGPTLMSGLLSGPLFSQGTLWIEPNTGRILKTEFLIENKDPKEKGSGRSVVAYEENKQLGILVPAQMVERYESSLSYVDCQAFYSNFRSYNVTVSAQTPR